MVTAESFISEIDAFLKRSGMSPTAFGKAAVGDPSFVPDLRTGRMPGLRLVNRVQSFIADQDRGKAAETAEATQ